MLQGINMTPNHVHIIWFEILESITGQMYYPNFFDLEQEVKFIFAISIHVKKICMLTLNQGNEYLGYEQL